ncbi:hypothetical protein ACIBK9_47360 [Nonomuraea sp. NPDC050227]|uniref:hypothetical protein n=1 Tax=Nonomuraea sp. NPDC050227 TaxID=3364360 RepID=UPI0037B253FC
MAGSYAKIFNEIWADPDFRSLSRGQQWLYFALISQPELNFAGVVTTTDRRLTGCAAGFTVDELRADLKVLEARRYVVVDDEHDEILVRSYVRHDGAWRTPNVLTSIVRAAVGVRSTAIRATLAEELARLPLQELSGKKAEDMRASVTRVIETLRPRVAATVPARVSRSVTARVTETLPEGLVQPSAQPIAEPIVVVAVVGEEVKDRTSVTLPHDPSPPSESESEGVLIELPTKPKIECGSDQDPDFVAFWTNYPRKVGKPSARTAWRKAIKAGVDPKVVIEAAAAYRDDPERRRRGKQFTPHPSTWLNDDRYEPDEDDEDDTWTWSDVQEAAPAEFN